MKRCPFCAEEIQDAAIVCKHCGRELVPGISLQQPPATTQVILQQIPVAPSRGIAAVLSLIIPGAGQMYRGRVASGVVWLFVVVIGYFFLVIPGAILHICCILAAASGPSSSQPSQGPMMAPAPARPNPSASNVVVPSASLAARQSFAAERGVGRFVAIVAHPRLAWRSQHASDRAIVIAVYGIAIFYVLRIVLLDIAQ